MGVPVWAFWLDYRHLGRSAEGSAAQEEPQELGLGLPDMTMYKRSASCQRKMLDMELHRHALGTAAWAVSAHHVDPKQHRAPY
jgi:hypothetical protein